MNIYLCKMTKELARQYFREFLHAPDVFMDMSRFSPYVYNEENADASYERQIRMGREYFAVMWDDLPIGEVVLKNIDQMNRCCTLGIHLQNDSEKNQGYGTQAERLALAYAFETMGMETVYADAIL